MRLLLVTCILATPGAVLAQSAGADGPSSTRAGVYTEAQAARGRDIYALSCVSCHTPISHTGPAFAVKWDGHQLSELFQYLNEAMPKQDPGTLSAIEYTLVLTYLLKLNGMPAGRDELPSDLAALQKIRIEWKAPGDSSEKR